jgi:hypothetical protein
VKHYFVYSSIAVAVVVLVMAGFYLWHKSELAIARTEERVRAQDAVIQQARDAIAESERKRAQAIADLEAAHNKPATVQTVVKYLPAPMPEGSEVKLEQLPDAPAPQIVLSGDPQTNLQALLNMELAHKECDINLHSCSEKLAAEEQKQQALTTQRDEWQKAARGGSKWHRFSKSVKVSLCAGAGAGLGLLAKQKSTGAAIGGAVGAAACEVVF